MNDAGIDRIKGRRHAVTRSWLARGSAVLMGTSVASIATVAVAGPEGGDIVAGVGSISQIDPATTLISQGSHHLGIDWDTIVDLKVRGVVA